MDAYTTAEEPPTCAASRPQPRAGAALRTCAGAAEDPLERLERRERRLKANDGRRARLIGRAGARTGLGRAMGRREGESTGVRGLCMNSRIHLREVCFCVFFRARAILESVLWLSRTLYIESFP